MGLALAYWIIVNNCIDSGVELTKRDTSLAIISASTRMAVLICAGFVGLLYGYDKIMCFGVPDILGLVCAPLTK
jgi:hypothetical protein